MSKYVISKVCPACGGNEYEKRRSEEFVALTSVRVCQSCVTRYTPPAWAGVVFILAGWPR